MNFISFSGTLSGGISNKLTDTNSFVAETAFYFKYIIIKFVRVNII